MEKIQNYVMQDGDPDKTPSVEEMPAASESIHPQARPLEAAVEFNMSCGSSFHADLENQLRQMKAI